MKKTTCVLIFYMFSLTWMNVLADDLTDDALRIYYNGSRSQALSMFREIYSNNNKNAEALYDIVVADYEDNVISKEKFISELSLAAELSIEAGDNALAHYIQAQLASKTGDSELALVEISNALEIEPDSVRYLRGKMLFLGGKGEKLKKDELVYKAFEYGNKAIDVVDSDPKHYFTKGSLHFEIARWVHVGHDSQFGSIKIDHYKKSIELNEMSDRKISFAWNNMSHQLYTLNQCREAKVAAENALKIMSFGYARQNLESANACIAGNNIFYRIWYKIESFIKSFLRFFD